MNNGGLILENISLYDFFKVTDSFQKKELEKANLILYYIKKHLSQHEITIEEVINYFDQLSLSKPNKTRLLTNMKKSKDFIISGKFIKLSAHAFEKNEELYSDVFTKNSDLIIVNHSAILDDSLYLNTRGYIEKLSLQINSTYENNIFDGCAMLMRRLFEILLIHSYEANNVEQEIKNEKNDYHNLAFITKNAEKNSTLSLSRNTKSSLEPIRKLGNFAAHKIYYNTKKKDIDDLSFEYRATIEELLYKSKIKK